MAIKEIIAAMMVSLNLTGVEVTFTDEKELCKLYVGPDRDSYRACENKTLKERGWGILGLQLGNYVGAADHLDYTKIINQSIIYHELVHVAQLQESVVYPCRGMRERDAYKRQYEWLQKQGYTGSFTDMYTQLGLNSLSYKLNTECSRSFD